MRAERKEPRTRLYRFWQALESIPGLALIWADWKDQLGPELEVVKDFLRPTNLLTEVYPCPSPGGDGCPRRIVVHGDNDIVAVCGDSPTNCDRLTLQRADIIIYKVDLSALCEKIKKALRLLGRLEPTKILQTWRLGNVRKRPSDLWPVYLHLPRSTREAASTIMTLLLEARGAFVLITPTRDHLSNDVLDRLQTQGAHFLTLDDLVTFENGSLIAAVSLTELFAADEPPPAPLPTHAFRKRGAYWEAIYEGQQSLLKDQKGLVYLQVLLKYPDRSYSARELMLEAGEGQVSLEQNVAPEDDLHLSDQEGRSGDELLDQRALHEYRQELKRINLGLEEARSNADLATVDRLGAEREHYQAMLKAAVGLGGRGRTFADDEKRLRDRINRALNRAFKRITKQHSTLGRHLSSTISRRPHAWSYLPEADLPWEF